MIDGCSHEAAIRDVIPNALGCEECLKTGSLWVHLRLCRSCGHVGCCDDSPNRHATRHFRETRHPAIEGYDPVGYFVDARPEVGVEDFEASAAGAVWRFRNEGNQASFVAHPDIYGPQFGGYDPIDLARGVTVAGNPRFWLVSGERLYLFNREETRAAFVADPSKVLRSATQRWPGIQQSLADLLVAGTA